MFFTTHLLHQLFACLTMQTRTVQVKNLSDLATEREIHEFFSFSGDIEHIEIISETSQLKTAYVTFKDPKALEIALLLSGATLVDKIVNIISAENYVPKLEIHESRAADGIMSVSPAGHSASNDEVPVLNLFRIKMFPNLSGSHIPFRVSSSSMTRGSLIGVN
ncbi:binding partner of ACD11 1-like [Hibiscus syriacus]|uniref:binding partner of ACD11 1-like n=1 Tax=Hibiscus syriacus TaxID=106335 RepID=UPI0019224C71|nr:binding partner of ACD11 1-like [Hibiscus syriacus]